MKIVVTQKELQNALSVVAKGVASRSTLPVLSGIYVNAAEDTVTFQATNGDLSIQCSCIALIEKPGRTVVPGKLFTDIVKSLKDGAVTLEEESGFVTLTCCGANFQVKTLNPDDFPSFPHVDVNESIQLPFSLLGQMIKRIIRAISKDEGRAILTGALFVVEEGKLRIVATDSYRLALTEAPCGSLPEGFNVVVSGAFLSEIVSLPKTEEMISLAFSENQIVVTYQETVLINRRIEGNYVNYKQLLPHSYMTKVTVNRQNLTEAVKRVMLLSDSIQAVTFTTNENGNEVELSASAADIGSVKEVLPAVVEGEAAQISFNGAYIIDGLSVADTEKISLNIQSGMKPGVFKVEDEIEYLYLIMPVRV